VLEITSQILEKLSWWKTNQSKQKHCFFGTDKVERV